MPTQNSFTSKQARDLEALQTKARLIGTQEGKEKVKVVDHFKQQLGTSSPRPSTFDWSALGTSTPISPPWKPHFPKRRSKRPSSPCRGFTGIFFKSCWDIVKNDLSAAFNQLHNMNRQDFDLLNTGNIVLIPKKLDATRVGDYRPISRIHSIAKIFFKLLANKLAPLLDQLVSKCQSAFIRKRCIQDNFLYVQNVVRQFHKAKTPALFLKLDIQKVFDTINWSYLLEMLQACGFGPCWREWISILFSTTSSRALINGVPGESFDHRRGVRQGDPLSPMLFILAIDPLQKILDLATQQGVLTPLPLTAAKLRTSIYTNDAAIFLSPAHDQLQAIKQILLTFGVVTGLVTNFDKSSVHPIRCEDVDLAAILQPFQGACMTFPCKYLGLQLHTRPLQKVHGQRLAGWKGKLLNRAGCLTLITSVVSSMPTYHLTIFCLAKWARKKIDKVRHSFLWKGTDNAHGGHCLVNWPTICLTKNLGGLGVLDHDCFGCPLRLYNSKTWAGLLIPCNNADRLLFQASISISIGNGKKTKF
ncbi:hypothetical protein U9M48_039246 [Paspalum notatum var. saurae]|uniref:Reverse transcriptase domain-containing protein n=1 Tax=Paspalum notatum var. saurae TaxID=547442 RepID=A0AAQ3XCH7_PASNO